MYVHFNPNPKYDPVKSSWNRGDCVIRAISCAMNWSWTDSYYFCFETAIEVGDIPNTVEGYGEIMRKLNSTRVIIDEKCKMTVNKFAQLHKTGIYILSVEGITGHVVCCKDGDWYDAFDTGNFLVYGYHEISKQLKLEEPVQPKLSLFQHVKNCIKNLSRH